MKSEIILYRPNETAEHIEVRLEDETVWLSQQQMATLFNQTKQNVSLHINNCYREGELERESTVKESLTVQIEGSRKVKRKLSFYNLDVIISVGYRVKSHRGTQFRIWANKILKDYLLKGYAVSHRLDKVERKLAEHDAMFDLLIQSDISPKEGIFYDGQIFDAWEFVSGIIKEAGESIILIDNYVDESVLSLLAKRKTGVTASVYTANLTQQLKHDLTKHNRQYPAIEVHLFRKAHDRFLIIDRKTVYHIGASLKDLGKKWFAFSRINLDAEEMVEKLVESR